MIRCLVVLLLMVSFCGCISLPHKGQSIYLRDNYKTESDSPPDKYADYFLGLGGSLLAGVAIWHGVPFLGYGLGTLSLLNILKAMSSDYEIKDKN